MNIIDSVGRAYQKAVPQYAGFLERERWGVLALFIFFIAFMATYAVQLEVDSSQEAFFYENDPVKLQNDLVNANFNSADAMTIFLRLDKSSTDFDRIRDIHDPQVVEYVTTIKKKLLEKSFVDFVITPADNPALFSKEGGSALIMSYMDMGSDDKQLSERKRQIEELVENTKTPTGIELSVGGSPVIFSEVSRLLFNDLIVTGLLSLVIIAFSIRIFYGSNQMTIVNIFILICAMTCIFGSMKLLDVPLNIATALIAVLTIGIGVDYTLHLQNGFARTEGRRRYVVTATLQKIGPPLSMAFVTTLIGFSSLFFAGSRVMETLAISTSLGIFYVFLFNMTLTPVIYLIFGSGKSEWGNFKEQKKVLYARMPDLANIIGNYTFAFTIAVVVFAFTVMYGITMVNTETDYSGFIPADNPIIMDLTEQADAFPGTTSTMNIILEAEDVLEYEVLKEMDDFSKRLTGMEYVEFVRAPVDDIKALNDGQIPETRTRIDHPDVGNDYKMIRMTVGYSNQIATNNDVFYGVFIPSVTEKFPDKFKTYYAGEIAYSARENEITESGSQMVSLVSFVLIFIILVVYFRSVIIGVLMLLPIFLAILSTMGIDGWTGIPFSQITSSIFGIIIGLGMDFSIHSGNEMREELERGASYAGAVEATHVHLAKLLFLTSLTTVLGFLALQFAQLSFLKDLGLTLAFGILFAFFYSVFLLPALIVVYYRFRRWISKGLKR
jgi:hydrophobe/amphiphile efflux-3 (HAE3) family protein